MANTSYVYTTTATNWPSYGNITVGAQGTSGASLYSTGSSYNWGTITSGSSYGTSGQLHVSGTAKIDGDLTVQGISIVKTLEKINERLAILVPDPAKLEKYAALKKAYDHYKVMESLITEQDTKDK
jgi:hypothetical protein